MFDQFENVREAFATNTPVEPLRLRKSLKEKLVFWAANALLLPLIALCYLSIGSEGLRQLMPIFELKLYRLPLPGAGYLELYDGFNRADLSMLFALLLFIGTTFVWERVFKTLQGTGAKLSQVRQNPVLFYFHIGIAVAILLGDAGIFYVGLEVKASSSWIETPGYVALLASAVYLACLALVGAWRADYYSSGAV